MKAGIGQFEITPPLGVELAGYGYYLERRAEGVRDPLYARAMYLTQGDTRAMIISCDLLGLCNEVVGEVKRAFSALIPPENIIIVSIHTHTGPCTKYHLGCGEVNPEYVRSLAEKIIKAGKAALEDAADVVKMESSVAGLPSPFAYNRTIKDGQADQNVRALRLTREEKPAIEVVSYACHNVSLGRIAFVSADYAGEVNRLEEALGVKSIYVNGLCGDIDPIAPKEIEAREQTMFRFAQAIVDAAHAAMKPCEICLKAGEIPFALRLTRLGGGEIRARAKAALEDARSTLPHTDRIISIWEDAALARPQPMPETEDIRVHYARVGDMLLVALPFEGYTLTGELMREALGSERVMVLGCAEQLCGYLPTREDIAVGSYASIYSPMQDLRMPPFPGEAERLGREIGEKLAGL